MLFRQFLSRLTRFAAVLVLAAVNFSCNRSFEAVYVPVNFSSFTQLQEADYLTVFETDFSADHITEYFSNPETREITVDFFANITKSREIAEIILNSAVKESIAPALAFALAYEESRFNPKAVNTNADSIDRGLFQLNSKAFEKLAIDQFYNPVLNSEYAMKHLRYCLDTSSNEFAALAMYNAGPARVKKGNTPEKTLNYIYRINMHSLNIQSLFEAQIVARHASHIAMNPKSTALP